MATIANITATLDSVRWDGWGVSPELWTVIMLAAGVVIAGLMAATRRVTTQPSFARRLKVAGNSGEAALRRLESSPRRRTSLS